MFSTLRIWKLTGLLLLINISMFAIEALNGVSILSPRMGDLLIWGALYLGRLRRILLWSPLLSGDVYQCRISGKLTQHYS